MNHDVILNQLYNGNLTVQEAYDTVETAIDTKNLKRAFFVKMRISLPNESRGLNIFLRLLFGVPVPIGLVRFFLKIANKNNHFQNKLSKDLDLDPETIGALLTYARGTTIKIESDDAIVSIKIR